jgi:ubiquinone/menaquinone biosynthesis C-methylase UbiE
LTRAFAAFAAMALLLPLPGCDRSDPDADRPETARAFPRADRPVSSPGTSILPSEEERERLGEAETIIDLAAIEPGMTVADIGAGEGYYAKRLSEQVGPEGRVVGQDIDPEALRQLGLRVERERLENISILRGEPDDPRLPKGSFDRILLVHMYHEVTEPYAFLWRLSDALRKDGRVIVVETDRPTGQNGIPPALLFCEFKAVGYELGAFVTKPELGAYYARFDLAPKRPEPSEIRACRASREVAAAAN